MLSAALVGILAILPRIGETEWVNAKLGTDGRIDLTQMAAPPGHRGVFIWTGPVFSHSYQAKEIVVYRVDGSRVDPKELPSLLREGAVVLSSVRAFPTINWQTQFEMGNTLICIIPEPVAPIFGF